MFLDNLQGFPRTSNKVEAWHRRWNNLVGNPHVDLWKIIKKIISEQNRNEFKITEFRNQGKFLLE